MGLGDEGSGKRGESVEVQNAFISMGCNRVVGAVDWGPGNLVAFGAHNSVAIFCSQKAKILVTLLGHQDSVNCVLWVPTSSQALIGGLSSEEVFLLSGSADGYIILWGYLSRDDKWRSAFQVKGHDKAVTSMVTFILSSSEIILSTTSSDGSVCVWKVSLSAQAAGACQISLLQTIPVGSRTMVSTSLTALPGSQDAYLLALGGLDNHVHFYAGTSAGQFIPVCKVKAHDDWVRSLDFKEQHRTAPEGAIFLASSSQDKSVKIWKISQRVRSQAEPQQDGISEKLELSLKTYIDGPVFKVGDSIWQVSLESLLLGHEDWVYSVQWQPKSRPQDGDAMCVLTASMDRTMMIWKPNAESGIWINEVTVGELSHTALGFYGGVWGPKGNAILAHGYGGSFHMWTEVELQDWKPHLTPSGHFAPVLDIAWSKTSQYLLSASNDQTTRVFAPWTQRSEEDSLSWHEIGRPQVHGHDLNCLAVVGGRGNHSYVSGADEKVARVFEAPGAFLDTLASLVGGKMSVEDERVRQNVKILGANMSALGLSQKPIYSQDAGDIQPAVQHSSEPALSSMDFMPEASPAVLTEPPLEEHLCQNTLWPETHKLYGHGNELHAMCCDHSAKCLATACKAQSAEFAQIWLWDVESWRPVYQLKSHQLTVTQMEFSHNDKFLLSVSRDRHLSLFYKDDDRAEYRLATRIDAHKRIVWACTWSHCDRFFATGSRDKVVKIWSVTETNACISVTNIVTLPPFRSAVTALAWGPSITHRGAYLLAVGMEDGSIELWQGFLRQACEGVHHLVLRGEAASFWKLEMSILKKVDQFLRPVATVQRLRWRPSPSVKCIIATDEVSQHIGDDVVEPEDAVWQLASSGADHSVRIFDVKFT